MSLGVFTLLYDTSYLPGVIVLGISLRRILTVNPRNVTIGILIDKSKFNSAQLELIEQFYDDIIDVSPIQSKLSQKLHEELGRPELDMTFTKALLWSLSNYDRILYLDADTLPLIPKAASDGSVIDLLNIDFPKHKIMASPDSGFPDIFNSGVFVLKPDTEDFNRLYELSQLQNSDISFDGADQGLLNQYFNTEPDWVNNLNSKGSDVLYSEANIDTNWIRVPFLYNVTPSAQYEYLPAYNYFTKWKQEAQKSVDIGAPREEIGSSKQASGRYFTSALKFTTTKSNIKLMHFIGSQKPWKTYCNTGIYNDWWNIWRSHFGDQSIESILFSKPSFKLTSDLQQTEQHRLLNPLVYTNVSDAETSAPEIETSAPEVGANAPEVDKSVLEFRNNVPEFRNSVPEFRNNVPEVGISIDASWDATKEPPHVYDKDKHENIFLSDFNEKLSEFNNAWDQDSDNTIEVSHDATDAIATQTLPYTTVAPERVFNDHFTILSSSNNVLKTPESDIPPVQPHAITTESELETVVEQLDSVALNKPSATFIDESAGSDSGIAKIFPWEFRPDLAAPERHFD